MDTIIISITDACMLRCKGCYATKNMPKMGITRFKNLIDTLKQSGEEIQSITLTGGEPFSNSDLPEIAKYCTEQIRKPRIVTSGYYPIVLLDKVKDYIELLTVTIKYPDYASNSDSNWRGAKDTLLKSKAFLARGKELNIPLSINWIADRQNAAYVYHMQRLASEFGAILQVVRFIPYEDYLRVFALTDEQWEQVCFHAKKFENVHIAFPSRYSYKYCTGGQHRIYIRTDGSITPCIYLSETLGNIFEDSFQTILKKGEQWRLLNSTLNGKPIKGCLGYLKVVDPIYKNMKFDQNNVIKVMQMRRTT